jgi:hypothetical protein
MAEFFNEFIIGRIKRFFLNTFSAVVEINKKYAHPQIKTSRAVKFSLLCLRLYLILLIGILFYKFYTTVVK